MSDPMSDPNSEPIGQQDHADAAAAARPPAFPSVDRDHAGSIWRPANDELLTPPSTVIQRVASGPRTPVWRWLVALVATIAVVGVVAGVGYLAIRRAGSPSAVSHYAPAGTAAYVEMNLNLPGDQRDQLVSFLGHFPGFADPSSFQQKLDDSLNQLLVSSGSGLSWDQDVAPWFGGMVALFGDPAAEAGGPSSMTAVLSVTDSVAADTTIRLRLGPASVGQPYGPGQMIWSLPQSADQTVYLAVTDDALIVSDQLAQVEAALDVKAGKQASLADDDFFLRQLASLHADRLATFYFDYGAMAPAMSNSLDNLGGLVPDASSLGLLGQLNTGKVVGEARAEGDHLAINMRASHASGDNAQALPSNRHTALAERMPADSLVYFETRDFGQAVKHLFDTLGSVSPSASGAPDLGLQSITELLGTEPKNFLDFVQDVGVSVDYANDKLGVGLVATVDDENVARTRVERLLSAVRSLAAFGSNGGVSVEDVAHGDVTITMIHVTSSALPGLSGSVGLPDVGVPDLNIGVAVANGQLLIGLDDFVANALDRTAADSLAESATFKSAASVADDNAGVAFIDIAGLRSVIEQAMPAAGRADYEQNVKPFLAPLDHLLAYYVTDGDISETHLFLYVR